MTRVRIRPFPPIEFHQSDWQPGWAAFIDDGQNFNEASKAFCTLNLGAHLAAIETGAMRAADMPYLVAETMMHEIVHVIEKWAGIEFSEERVEALLDRYRERYGRMAGETVSLAA